MIDEKFALFSSCRRQIVHFFTRERTLCRVTELIWELRVERKEEIMWEYRSSWMKNHQCSLFFICRAWFSFLPYIFFPDICEDWNMQKKIVGTRSSEYPSVSLPYISIWQKRSRFFHTFCSVVSSTTTKNMGNRCIVRGKIASWKKYTIFSHAAASLQIPN